MSILNVNQVQPIGSGKTFTVNAENVTFSGAINGNINSTGIVTARTITGVTTAGISTVFATSIVGVTTAGITTAYIGSVNDGPISGARNKIINGDMRIDQRNAGVSTTVAGLLGAYTLDRWMGYEFTDGAATIIRSGIATVGFSSSLLWTTTTADASLSAGQFAMIQQKIEGFNTSDLNWGTSSAKPVTLSFYVRSSLTGTFDGAIVNGISPADRSYIFNYTISSADTWEYKTVTIPGDTTGTWYTDNTASVVVRFSMGTGTTYQTTANVWTAGNFLGTSSGTSVVGTLNATWYVTGVQLEAGTVATPFERRSYGQELALCQRYFQFFAATQMIPGQANSSTGVRGQIAYQTKRSAPTITASALGLANDNITSVTINSVAFSNITIDAARYDCTLANTNLVDNGICFCDYAVSVSAEL